MGSALAQYVDVIQGLVTNGFSHEEISNIMQGRYGVIRGASERSIRRFCAENGLRQGGRLIKDDELNNMVSTVVNQVICIYKIVLL